MQQLQKIQIFGIHRDYSYFCRYYNQNIHEKKSSDITLGSVTCADSGRFRLRYLPVRPNQEGGTDKQAHTLKFPKDSENMDTGGNSKFFIRYIDTITLDTMYFVCRIDIHGDTIPDQIEVRYANDSICSYQYYLNNNGDTVLLDYSRQQDQIAQQDTLVWENDSLFNEVQDSILNADEQRLIEDVTEYLDRIAQKGLEKERTIDSLRRENRESKELRELLRDPEIPDLP